MTTARTRNAKPKQDPAPEPPAFDAASLLASATLISRENNHRESVVVPPEIVEFAQRLYDTQQAAKFPVPDDKTFAEQKLMWQSAGDKTTPQTSAIVTEIREAAKDDNGKPVFHRALDNDGNPAFTKDPESGEMVPEYDADSPVMNVVGLRVSFGQRRGNSKRKNASETAAVSG